MSALTSLGTESRGAAREGLDPFLVIAARLEAELENTRAPGEALPGHHKASGILSLGRKWCWAVGMSLQTVFSLLVNPQNLCHRARRASLTVHTQYPGPESLPTSAW